MCSLLHGDFTGKVSPHTIFGLLHKAMTCLYNRRYPARHIQIVFELRYSIFTLTAPESRKISGLVQGEICRKPLHLMVKTTVSGSDCPNKTNPMKNRLHFLHTKVYPKCPHTSPQLAMETPLLEKRMSKNRRHWHHYHLL